MLSGRGKFLVFSAMLYLKLLLAWLRFCVIRNERGFILLQKRTIANASNSPIRLSFLFRLTKSSHAWKNLFLFTQRKEHMLLELVK